MHNRTQFIENIKNYLSSEEEYSLTALLKKETDHKNALLELVTTDTPQQELSDNYASAIRFRDFTEKYPETMDKVIEFLVKQDAEKAQKPFTHFEKQLDHLKEVLETRPDALSDEQLVMIDQYVRHNASLLNKPRTDIETIKQNISDHGVLSATSNEALFFHRPTYMSYDAKLYPEYKNTIEDAVVLYDINKAVEELGGTFHARGNVANQKGKEASFMTFPVKAGEPRRKAEMIQTAVIHGLPEAYKGIAEGLEFNIEDRDLDDQYRGYVLMDVLYDRDADVTALVEALKMTVSDLETEARLKAEAEIEAQENAAFVKALDEMIDQPAKPKGFLGRLLQKATILPVNIPPLQTVKQGQESAPEQSFE